MFKTLIFPALIGGCLMAPVAATAQEVDVNVTSQGVTSGVRIQEGDVPADVNAGVDGGVEVSPVESSTAPATLPSSSHAAPVDSHTHHHHGEVVDGGVVHHGHGIPAVGGHFAGKGAVIAQKIALAANPNGWYPPYAAHPWHGHYRHTQYSQPLALVVPPTAAKQTAWSWGVGNTTSQPIYHQFGRQYPGAGPQAVGGPYWMPGQQFAPTPIWPSHTDQFGVYYIRGPW